MIAAGAIAFALLPAVAGQDKAAKSPARDGTSSVVELAPLVVDGQKGKADQQVGVDRDKQAALQRIRDRTRRMAYDFVYSSRTDEQFFGAEVPGKPADTPRISPIRWDMISSGRVAFARFFDRRSD